MVQGSCRVGPRSSTLKIDRNFNFTCVVLLLSITIFVISLCCPFWPVRTFCGFKNRDIPVHILERGRDGTERTHRRKTDEDLICATSIRESKEEGKSSFMGTQEEPP